MKCKTRWCYFNLLIHKILQKDAQKGDFWNSLDPFLGFILKTVPGIHDPRISGLPFGTKNHEMRGPPVVGVIFSKKELSEAISKVTILKVTHFQGG